MQLGGRQERDEVLIGCSERDVEGLALVCTHHVFDLLLRLLLKQLTSFSNMVMLSSCY
jgi:hypothetical protein